MAGSLHADKLQKFVDRARKRLRVPGVAVGLIVDGREVVATSGVTSADNPLPVTDRTLFMIGSTSKTFTATAFMRLVDQGKLGLDDPVIKHLPKFRLRDAGATRALTLRHLVTHTGGWDGDIDLDTGWGDDALERYVDALKTQRQQLPVGTAWAYNNAGFSVLGRVIEVVTGKTFEAAMAELVFAPLGMNDSFFFPIEVLTRRFAVGHFSRPSGPRVMHTWGLPRALAPAGGIASTVRDQLAYARFHLGDGRGPDGKRLLSKKNLRLMHSNLQEAGNFVDWVGVSWMIEDIGGARTVAHGGNVGNIQLSSFRMVPDRGFAITVLTNATKGGQLHDDIEAWALDHHLDIRRAPREPKPVERGELDQYAGRYSGGMAHVDVTVRNGHLKLTPVYDVDMDKVPEDQHELIREILKQKPKPSTIALYAPDRAVVLAGPGKGSRIEFIRTRPRGRVTFMRSGGRLAARAR